MGRSSIGGDTRCMPRSGRPTGFVPMPTARPLLPLCLTILLVLASAMPSVAAGNDRLTVRKARAITAAKAERFARALASEGAQSSFVGKCARVSRRRVWCLAGVTGYDAEAEMDWTCLTPVHVRKPAKGPRRLRVRFGTPLCG